MDFTKYKKDARIFKAFCDENRLYILTLLQNGEKCACKLLDALQISQSTLSHHMKILCDAGIVTGRKEGKWIYYSLSPQGAGEARKLLAFYTSVSPEPETPGKDASAGEKPCC
ncbi:MAG: ArsR/SmtB family transcription factor [Clostridia bacterium]